MCDLDCVSVFVYLGGLSMRLQCSAACCSAENFPVTFMMTVMMTMTVVLLVVMKVKKIECVPNSIKPHRLSDNTLATVCQR